jgi:hypothetical protein
MVDEKSGDGAPSWINVTKEQEGKESEIGLPGFAAQEDGNPICEMLLVNKVTFPFCDSRVALTFYPL